MNRLQNYARNEIEKYMQSEICPVCSGTRLNSEARNVTIQLKSIADVNEISVHDSLSFFKHIAENTILSEREKGYRRTNFKRGHQTA